MHKLFSSKYFLITTALFLVITVVVIWFFFPPLLGAFNENRAKNTELAQKLAASQADQTTMNELTAAKVSLADLSAKATLALPSSPSADLLLLQLDGLTKSLGLEATITVPFSQATPVSQVAAPVSEGEVKPGSGSTGGTQPIVTSPSASSKTDFSLSGNWDFPTVLNLLTKLKTFSRWNNITSVDLVKSADKSTATISGKVFWTPPETNLQFSGSVKELLSQGKTLFGDNQSYAEPPDITREGNFGKSNPFTP